MERTVTIMLEVAMGARVIRVPVSAYTREDAERRAADWLRRWGGRVISKTVTEEVI